VPNSAAKTPYRPFKQYEKLYKAFAEIKTCDELLRFIKHFGSLDYASADWGDDVAACLRAARYFRELLLAKQMGPRRIASVFKSQKMAESKASWGDFSNRIETMASARLPDHVQESLTPVSIGELFLWADPNKGVRISIEPRTLMSALWWQLGQELLGNVIFRECRECGALFESGAGSSRRADATFCCSEHSVRFHSLKRSRGG
jgi:hypothetical protein